VGLIHEKRGQKYHATVPLKSSQKHKTPDDTKIINFMLLHGQKHAEIAEVKLSSCGLRNCGVAEHHFFQKVAE
jgi:hypothetical protein